MTLCFFVTMSLGLFYSLYRGFLTREIWYYVFFALVGISVLAKGPLGIVLPALVAGVFVVLRKRWDLVSKFCLHPGVVLMLILGAGWYVIAVTRGGEGFFDRQIIEENLSRFAGGSGHSHPPYYYIPYLFALGLPWSLFLPFLLWDSFKRGFLSDDDSLFLKLWVLAMFVFFSISMGKRPVYILPIYPALSLLMAIWFYHHGAAAWTRRMLYRFMAALAGAAGLMLIVLTLGALWSHDPGWFFSPVERLLKAKDRANLLLVKNALATFGWSFTVVSLLSGLLWLSLARSLWVGRLRSAAWRLVLIAVPVAFITRAVVMPVIAEAKSYREFMSRVNQQVTAHNKLLLYGSFNSDPVIFYRGGSIETIDQPLEEFASRIGSGDLFIIMPEQLFVEIQKQRRDLPPPLLKSAGTGPEGDARLVLVRGGEL
jgi:4-amino-4-deoxy-L-arabinose transferase-like glycosyltransferase